MNSSDSSKQIKQMVNFIMQESHEKVNEIRIKVRKRRRLLVIKVDINRCHTYTTSIQYNHHHHHHHQKYHLNSYSHNTLILVTISLSSMQNIIQLSENDPFNEAVVKIIDYQSTLSYIDLILHLTIIYPISSSIKYYHLSNIIIYQPSFYESLQTDHDFNLEKQNLVHSGKLKVQEEYAQKIKDLEIEQKV